MTVRAMRAGELESVIRLWHETSRDTYDFLPLQSEYTLDDRLEFFTQNVQSRCALWVALESGEIKGFLALDGSYVDRLYVDPRAQRLGFGSALIDKARAVSPEGLEPG